MKTAKAYVYFENSPEDEEFDEELSMMSCTGSEKCLFSGDLENAGFDKDWLPEGPIPETGFYEVEYEWDTDDERCDGYVMYTYAYVVGIVAIRKSLKARLLWEWNMVVEPKVDFVCSLFQRRWGVDFDYGGAGIGSRTLTLPGAVWVRLMSVRREYDPGWGKTGYTARLRRY